jgi:ubiquinone/menaquinone biosynthesis C-methylase UbiE
MHWPRLSVRTRAFDPKWPEAHRHDQFSVPMERENEAYDKRVEAIRPVSDPTKDEGILDEQTQGAPLRHPAPLVPDVEAMFDGPPTLEEFKTNGEDFLRIYKEIAHLQPNEKMLDVGCGIGRKTLPLTQYLNEHAVYQGIDITKAGIDWCRARITPQFPNFQFLQIDVYNKLYNPDGKSRPSEYRFPFADDSFDFVMLGSVFTHMLPDDLENYLSEVRRVLTVKGRCLITYFLLNEESDRRNAAGRSTLDLKHVFDKYRTVSLEKPELAVAFNENWIKELYKKLDPESTRCTVNPRCDRQNYLSTKI